MGSAGIAVLVCLQLCLAGGQASARSSTTSEEVSAHPGAEDGLKLVCYYTPTGFSPASKVPSQLCTHLLYAFGSISGKGRAPPNITTPTAGVRSIWDTLTSLRRQNPQLKVLLSLQQGFPDVVGSDVRKMQQFAVNAVAFLRRYGFDGVDMDWEFPSSQQKTAFAQFFKIMRAAIDEDAKGSGKPALLLSLALPNNNRVVSGSYDIPTIASAVDFGTAMTYDFHVYNKQDTQTGYNSPLCTPKGEYQYLSASAMAEYYMSQGFPAPKLLLGIPTYGRSWKLEEPSSHGLHAPALGRGDPGPYRHLTGIYTYPDACVALQEGATSVQDTEAGAVYLYHGSTWVAYDNVITVTAKCKWAKEHGLGGVGVWAMHLDDMSAVCREEPLPLIQAMKGVLLDQPQAHPHLFHLSFNNPLMAPHRRGNRLQSRQQDKNRVHFGQNQIRLPEAAKEEDSSVMNQKWIDLRISDVIQEDKYGWKPQKEKSVKFSNTRLRTGNWKLPLQRRRPSNAVLFMESVDVQLEESAATSGRQK